MATELGAQRRTPARASASGVGSDENAPPDTAPSTPAPTEPGAAFRPPLRTIQLPASGVKREPQWPVPAPKKGLGVRAGKTPARVGAMTASLAPAKSVRKPALRLGLTTTGASSAEVQRFKIREAISFWEENHNVPHVSSTSQKYVSHAPAKIEDCSEEGFTRNSEDILLKLQLELDVLKTILVDEKTSHAEVEQRTTALGDELKAANLHILQACRQKEAMEKELNNARSVIEALESHIILINELDKLKKNNFQSPVLLKKRDMEIPRLNSELDIHYGKEYVPHEEPKMQTLICFNSEDSPLSTKLKRMQASLEKARNLNTRYQRDQESHSCAEQEMDEVRRQVEIETAEVILSLQKELSSLQQQLLDASNKNELLAKQSLDEIHRIELLLDESIETLVQKEVLEQNYVSLQRGMEEEICQLESQLDQSNRYYEARLKKLEIKRQEMDDEAATLLISWNKEKEIAQERKTYAEEKNEEVKLLERSIEDLEITVCSLENKVDIFKEEAEQQRRQREKLEVELQNVRQQLLAVPSSGKAGSSLEDGVVDLADSTRHPSDVNNELLGAQESRRILRSEVSEKESEILGPVQEGPTSSTIRHGRNMGMLPPFELMQQSYVSNAEPCADACSSDDISKEDADISLPDSHALLHITSQRKSNTNPVVLAVELATLAVEPAPLMEHPEEPSLDECMQEAEQLDVEMAQPHLADEDYWPESSQFEHPSAIEQLEMSSASEQPELYGNGADSDQSMSESGSEEKVRPPAVKPLVEVLKENELPPVAPMRPNDFVNYMRAPSGELKRLRSRNHYEGQRTATDRRFWSIEQQDLYTSIYSRAKLVDMKWIDWLHIDSIKQFAGVRKRCAHLGLEQIMGYCCDWDSELIRQFYSTVHISADKTSMTWMTDGRRITTNKRAWEEMFDIPDGVHTEIHPELFLDDDDKRILYTAAEYTLGHINGLSPLASIANKIVRTTIYPRLGNTTHNWNVLYHIVQQHSFDIIALIFGEIDLLISDCGHTKVLLLYAPYIMGMIMRVFEFDGSRESRHHSYKPRPHCKPKLSKNVSPSATPTAAPPVAAVPLEPPLSAFQREVAAVGHESHVDAVDNHHQFEAARHQPQEEAVQGQVQPITRTDLFQVVEDGLRPIRETH